MVAGMVEPLSRRPRQQGVVRGDHPLGHHAQGLPTYAKTGGIIAAPTTSLPETIGGIRNWDYRYCWIRDRVLTLYALLNAGYREEAQAWRQWLMRAAAGNPAQLQIMYGISGERWLPENTVPWLEGYAGSTPVQVGNEAAEQCQLDVYGELIDALQTAREAELQPLDEGWPFQKLLLAHVEKVWQEPDHGIWEMRGSPRAFTHSRLMCWVAFDRAVKSCDPLRARGPDRPLAEHCRHDPCRHLRERLRSAAQQRSSSIMAATSSRPRCCSCRGRVPAASDPRVIGTVKAIENASSWSTGSSGAIRRGQRSTGSGGEERLPGLLVLARRCLLHARAL